MDTTTKPLLPLDFEQVVSLVQQLSPAEQQALFDIINLEEEHEVNDPIMTHFASESLLAEDWLAPEEDEAWQDL